MGRWFLVEKGEAFPSSVGGSGGTTCMRERGRSNRLEKKKKKKVTLQNSDKIKEVGGESFSIVGFGKGAISN